MQPVEYSVKRVVLNRLFILRIHPTNGFNIRRSTNRNQREKGPTSMKRVSWFATLIALFAVAIAGCATPQTGGPAPAPAEAQPAEVQEVVIDTSAPDPEY